MLCLPVRHNISQICGIASALGTSKNYYKVLGVPYNASKDQVKDAFYSLSKKCHPDLSRNSTEEFIEIRKAYDVLNNEDTRNEYNSTLMFTRWQNSTNRNPSIGAQRWRSITGTHASTSPAIIELEKRRVHLDSSMMPPINPVEEYELRDSQRRRYTIAICLFFILLLAQIVLTKYTMKQL